MIDIDKLKKSRIIPVLSLDKAEDAIPICEALQAGGLEVVEVTFRTATARETLQIIKKNFPNFLLGAGTITMLKEVEDCAEAGAQFAVAPGLNPAVVKRAQEIQLSFFPGICTPTEVEAALDHGCTILKFFPADVMGGIKMLKTLYGPYQHRGVQFIPSGGINAENLSEYLSLPYVLAAGGSWLVDKKLIQEKNWSEITKLTCESIRILKELN